MHGLGRAASAFDVSQRLERRGKDSRLARWMRSLFAIYDIDQMVALDIPWWTFEAIDRVEAFLGSRPGARVFEYGSGASTIWLGRRAGSVTSVEHDADWYPVVAARAAAHPNIDLRLVPPDGEPHGDPAYASTKPNWRGRTFHDYVHAIDGVAGTFDVIVIDGRARTACLAHARGRLAPDGLIVFDNTHRPAYRDAIASSGLRATRTKGLTACLPYPDETTLLVRT
ncbi:class I SAM-dependent methyltransferase [uncultured Sphingomonas sp.]|uniref:class I SAM-dependent methyltransferase n=1 Tax=uncultured Sphingomonas sp. TaxID=158754 RepID=UPI0025DE4048|nr:class I SAM-dependent methyltransferase [uncultured Sphingomonas sp.]